MMHAPLYRSRIQDIDTQNLSISYVNTINEKFLSLTCEDSC